jgi:hypothetical protein
MLTYEDIGGDRDETAKFMAESAFGLSVGNQRRSIDIFHKRLRAKLNVSSNNDRSRKFKSEKILKANMVSTSKLKNFMDIGCMNIGCMK